jgi:hypothetical protein
MNKNINENLLGQNTINDIEENKNENEVQLNPEEPEDLLKEKDPQILNNKIQSNILDEKIFLFPEAINRKMNDIKSDISDASVNSEKKLFEVIYRKTHNCQSKDNITQSIITSFINFLLKFINNIIFEKLNKKDIFNIGHEIKSKIKLADILNLKVKEILAFQSTNIINNKNEEQIQEIKKNDSSLNKLFETPVIFYLKKSIIIKKKIKK